MAFDDINTTPETSSRFTESITSSLPASPDTSTERITEEPAALQPDNEEIFLIEYIVRHKDEPPSKKRKTSTKSRRVSSESGSTDDSTNPLEADKTHRQYLIKWQGWGSEYNTWEPHSNIMQDSPVSVKEYEQKLEWKRQRKLRRQGKLSERGQVNELHELKRFLLQNDLEYIVYGKRADRSVQTKEVSDLDDEQADERLEL